MKILICYIASMVIFIIVGVTAAVLTHWAGGSQFLCGAFCMVFGRLAGDIFLISVKTKDSL